MLHRHEFVDVDELLESVRRTGNPIARVVSARNAGKRLIEIVPILGPAGDAHGMHLWIGPDTEEPTPHRPASAMSWNLDDLQVRVTEQWWRMWLGPDGTAKSTSATLSPGEFFRNVVRFDLIDELVASAADPTAMTTHTSYAVVLHDLGYLMNWYNVARGRKDERHNGMRGLAIDVTDTNPPVISPAEVVSLTSGTTACSTREESRSTEPSTEDDGPAAALLGWSPRLRVPVVAQWISKVPSWIDWERKGDPMVFHPDDCEPLRRSFETLADGDEIAAVVRMRAFTDSGWQPATVISRRYPGEIGARLHIIRIAKTKE